MPKDDRLKVLRELIKQAEELQRQTSALIDTISEQVQSVQHESHRESASSSNHPDRDRRRNKRRATD